MTYLIRFTDAFNRNRVCFGWGDDPPRVPGETSRVEITGRDWQRVKPGMERLVVRVAAAMPVEAGCRVERGRAAA